MTDQACGCEADSGDPDYACDCAMQSHCICSHDANVLLMYVKKQFLNFKTSFLIFLQIF